MFADKPFTKENLNGYLKELAKEFRKKNGTRMPAEIILVGGASILINYGFIDLYDAYDKIPEDSRVFIESIHKKEDIHAFYEQCRELEQENKDVLIGFQEDYPGVLNGDNLADILKAARAKKQQ